MTLRTKETQTRYNAYRASEEFNGSCKLCDAKPIKEFAHWRIIDNTFPYDRIADPHHILIPKRHIREDELTEEERDEFKKLKHGYINDNYHFIFESTPGTMTIPAHFHLHLIVEKDE